MRSVRVWAAWSALSLALGFGASTHAAIVLDQSDIPQSGVIANAGATGGSALNGNRLGQSFSVGQTGTLSEIDLALIRTVDTPASDIQFDVRDTSNQVLFSSTIPGTAIPLFKFALTTWDMIPRIDVSGANLQVTPGEELWFTLAPSPNTSQTALVFEADGKLITYPTGELFNFTAAGPTGVSSPIFGSTGDYGFRTFVNVADPPPPVIFPPGGQPGEDAVPEPAQWMLMLLGFGGMGAVLRRRRAGAKMILVS
jgi:hypothetical protein